MTDKSIETEYKVIDKRNEEAPVPAIATPANEFFSFLESMASNPNVDVAKIEALIGMQERVQDREAKQAFNASMVRAQSKIKLVVAKSENKQTSSMYAKLQAVLLSANPIYTAEGFSLMFYEGEAKKENHKRVCVDIMHEDGHTEQKYGEFAIQTTGIAGKAMMTEIHGEGSAYSYGRRYLTCMIFNIPTGDDDDGNGAGGGGDYITEEQVSILEEMLKKVKGGTTDAFLGLMQCKSMKEIPAKKYGAARQAMIAAQKKSMEPEQAS